MHRSSNNVHWTGQAVFFPFKAWLASALLVWVLGCGQGPEPEPGEQAPRSVVTMTVSSPSRGQVRLFSGTARPAVETRLSFRVAGKIQEIGVKVGVRVAAGHVAARLDSTDYELEVKRRRARVAEVEARLEQAGFEYDRVRSLYEVESVSKRELDQARAMFASARARREAALEALALARKKVEYCVLKVPLKGEVVSVPVEEHQSVQAGQPIAVLASLDVMEMQLGVPAGVISRIKSGDRARVSFDALSGQEFQAIVSEVGVETGPTTTYPLTLRLLEVHPAIRPGMVGHARFDFPPPGNAPVVVPPQAVIQGAEQSAVVWVFDPDKESVHRREVQVGSLTSEGLQITSGLKSGARVVIRGVHRLEEGMRVRSLDQGSL
jgi:RND family efflux transporter MFP subunit